MGTIILARSLSSTFLASMAFCFAALLLAFLFAGSYTRRITISGEVMPDSGLVHVFAPQAGTVLEKRVAEGAVVRKGDILYVLSSERRTGINGQAQRVIAQQIKRRHQSLFDELVNTRRLQETERAELARTIDHLDGSRQQVGRQIDAQSRRIKLMEEAVARTQNLVEQNYFSKAQLQDKQAGLLEEYNRLRALERDNIAIARELDQQRMQASSAPIRHRNQLQQLERQLAALDQEMADTVSRDHFVIAAPADGVATAVLAETGQAVGTARPLFSIVPERAGMVAILHASSAAVGFVRAGNEVRLRYAAYPYQKFGHATGKVTSVSRTAVARGDDGSVNSAPAQGEDARYRVLVALDRQTVKAYGEEHALHAGMLLEADVMQERRRLYEWVLEPLYSVTGKL